LGHVAGDRLLKKFAKILRNEIRDIDFVGRIGGEEFMIIFPETDIEKSAKACERIRKKIEETLFYGIQKLPRKKITASIGLIEFSGKQKIEKEALMHRADINLYRAKSGGRNMIISGKI
jgi:diguanylate cyclase (GGDEF)-like protein